MREDEKKFSFTLISVSRYEMLVCHLFKTAQWKCIKYSVHKNTRDEAVELVWGFSI